MKVVSLRDNVAGAHGEVLRSSAVFYYRAGPSCRTTLSFLNYWRLKRGLEVAVYASLRTLAGELVRRERLRFDRGAVIDYRPTPAGEAFEGSVELEVFALQNLVIPYMAAVAIYETARGVTFVHSYGRSYSRHEVEEGRTHSQGDEGCWTLRDAPGVRSFAAFHNGGRELEAQRAELEVINLDGERETVAVELPALRPYATRLVRPAEHLPDLEAFLGGRPGAARLSFELGEAFTRMLVGNEATDGGDLQVTHSNFDYSRQRTDVLEPEDRCWMAHPRLPGSQVVVYPHLHTGRYLLEGPGDERRFQSGELVLTPTHGAGPLRFSREDGPLPTRVVTGLVSPAADGAIPNECSLGALTRLQPPKRLWWAAVAAQAGLRTRVFAHDLPEVYGGLPATAELSLRLYSAQHQEPLELALTAADLPRLEQGVELEALFPDAPDRLRGEPGYLTLFHEYGGLTLYTQLRNEAGSAALEHGF